MHTLTRTGRKVRLILLGIIAAIAVSWRVSDYASWHSWHGLEWVNFAVLGVALSSFGQRGIFPDTPDGMAGKYDWLIFAGLTAALLLPIAIVYFMWPF